MQVRHVCPPDVTSRRPSGSAVAVGYQRRNAMFGAADHVSATGSKMLAFSAPSDAESKPPTTRMRPSGSWAFPAQNKFENGFGTRVIAPVAGSHKRSTPVVAKLPENISTLPL